jgi:hypothetical protein
LNPGNYKNIMLYGKGCARTLNCKLFELDKLMQGVTDNPALDRAPEYKIEE